MIIVFKRAYVLNGKRRSVGNITRVTERKGLELIKQNIVEVYKYTFPPVKKIKTDFFKPK